MHAGAAGGAGGGGAARHSGGHLSAALALLLAGATAATEPPAYRPPASLRAFERVLRAQPSATAALAEWCGMRGMAGGQRPRIEAEVLPGAPPVPPPGTRRALGISDREPLAARHVRLSCGDFVLSEAWNWYVPGRLTPAMNATLATTRTPFGKAVAALGFSRHPLASRHGRAPGCPRGTVLSDRAVLRLPDGTGLALVLECYTRAAIGPVLTIEPGPIPQAAPR